MGRTQHRQARSGQTTKHKSTPHCAGHTLNTFVITLTNNKQTNKRTNKEVNTQTEIKENKKKNRYINSKLIQPNIQIICIRYEQNATRKQKILKNTKNILKNTEKHTKNIKKK